MWCLCNKSAEDYSSITATEDNACVTLAPCQNEGTCVPTFDTYRCICASGFVGTDCELVRDPCTTASCFNGGTCVRDSSTSRTFTCRCDAGYTGQYCESSVGKQGPKQLQYFVIHHKYHGLRCRYVYLFQSMAAGVIGRAGLTARWLAVTVAEYVIAGATPPHRTALAQIVLDSRMKLEIVSWRIVQVYQSLAVFLDDDACEWK